jgi:hypothetical protein
MIEILIKIFNENEYEDRENISRKSSKLLVRYWHIHST